MRENGFVMLKDEGAIILSSKAKWSRVSAALQTETLISLNFWQKTTRIFNRKGVRCQKYPRVSALRPNVSLQSVSSSHTKHIEFYYCLW